jgi:hypothetical protein
MLKYDSLDLKIYIGQWSLELSLVIMQTQYLFLYICDLLNKPNLIISCKKKIILICKIVINDK